MYKPFNRNGQTVWSRADLHDRQKEFCMCWDCKAFSPQVADRGCPRIKAVLELAQQWGLVLPVWECGAFLSK